MIAQPTTAGRRSLSLSAALPSSAPPARRTYRAAREGDAIMELPPWPVPAAAVQALVTMAVVLAVPVAGAGLCTATLLPRDTPPAAATAVIASAMGCVAAAQAVLYAWAINGTTVGRRGAVRTAECLLGVA